MMLLSPLPLHLPPHPDISPALPHLGVSGLMLNMRVVGVDVVVCRGY